MSDRPLPPQQPTISTVSSPCVRNCCLDDNDICLGCFRSLDEITAWGGADDTRRREILACAARRSQGLEKTSASE